MLNFFRHQHSVLSLGSFSARTWPGATFARARRFVYRIRAGAARHRRLRIQNLAAINPNFHADDAKRCVRFSKSVINIRTQSVQGKLALQVPLTPRDFRAVQTATDFDFDSLRAKAERLFHGLSHRAPKSNSLFELRRNLLSLQLRVQLGLMNLLNRNQHLAARTRRDVALQLVDLRALATDDDPGSRRVDDDLETVRRAFDVHVRYAGAGKASFQLTLQTQVFDQEIAVLLLRKPVRMPVLVIAKAKTVWMNFLAHSVTPFESES